MDHVFPRSLGGSNHPRNRRRVHTECNRMKRADWLRTTHDISAPMTSPTPNPGHPGHPKSGFEVRSEAEKQPQAPSAPGVRKPFARYPHQSRDAASAACVRAIARQGTGPEFGGPMNPLYLEYVHKRDEMQGRLSALRSATGRNVSWRDFCAEQQFPPTWEDYKKAHKESAHERTA
jgi:hypothetical protein